jgi:hypothetical protein
MEYHVVALKAEIATNKILESHWTLVHIDGEHSVSRYGVATVPPNNTIPELYTTITEEQAIQATKDLLGPEYIALLEQSVLDEMELKKNPVTVTGVPWADEPPPPGP